jgi:8-oxo-dGTP pyrophosphatase MutT (NUDIX family)
VSSPIPMWDGTPVARESPFGAMVVVFRRVQTDVEILLLHRRAAGPPGFDGDWAWTPPSGARRPDEPINACARRELQEETGLRLSSARVEHDRDWALYVAEASPEDEVVLDREHDELRWVAPDVALALCRPSAVADGVRTAIAAAVI